MLQCILYPVKGHAAPVLACFLSFILQYLGTRIQCTHVYIYYLFILQPVSPSREFPGPVHVVEEWREITKNATYRLLSNIGNKSFWKTTFRYSKNNGVFICYAGYCKHVLVLVYLFII